MPNRFRRIVFTWDALRIPYMGTLHPGIMYWASEFQIESLTKMQASAGVRLFDDKGSAPVPMWAGQSLNGKHATYYHDGALGDELIHAAFQRQVVMEHPGVSLHLISKSRVVSPVIPGNRYIGEYPYPWGPYIPEAAGWQFAHWIAPASVGYLHRGSPDNVYDLIAADIGICPDVKQPYAYIQGMARDEVRATIVNVCANFWDAPADARVLPPDFWDNLIVVQLNASEIERTPTGWYERLQAIVETVRGRFHVAVVGDEAVAREISQHGQLRVFMFLRGDSGPGPSPLSILVLTEAAQVVICPDSFLLHAAAAWGIPTIALWNMEHGARTASGLGIPPPSARMATYPNAVAVDKDGAASETVAVLKQIIGEG